VRILYRIVSLEDGTYLIEVSETEGTQYVVPGFKSEADAEAWAADRGSRGFDRWERQPDAEKRY